jgi:hypothetical protein
MKTTEMIAKVKEANNVTILSVRGLPIGWESMRDLGHTLYTLVDMIQEDSGMYRLFEKADGALVLAPTAQADIVGPHKISYPLEFDSFGELENWSHVSEEDATQLLTKAPVEPAQIEGVDLFKQVFDALELRYTDYYPDSIDDESAYFKHFTEDRWIDIMFDKGLVQVGHGNTCEPPRKLKITLEPIESNEPSTVPDTRTGYEVKAS